MDSQRGKEVSLKDFTQKERREGSGVYRRRKKELNKGSVRTREKGNIKSQRLSFDEKLLCVWRLYLSLLSVGSL